MKNFVYILFLALLFGCGSSEKSKVPVVLVTVPPYAYFIDQIAKNTVHVEILVPAGANPHIYEPSPKQVEEIINTAIWFRLGEPIENKILTILQEKNKSLIDVDLTTGIHLLSEHTEMKHHFSEMHKDEKDLHIWMSPELAKIQAKTIGDALIKAYPEHTTLFQQGLSQLLEELDILNTSLSQQLLPFKGEAILVSHPAFGYFCQQFSLKQISIESEGKDPLPQDVETMLKEAKSFHVRQVFTQPQYNNKGAILIAKELKLPVHEVDPYSTHYIENLRLIAGWIANAQ